MISNLSKYLRSDILSGFVVFLISVPLCLGIALASGAPLFSGMIAGIIGGIVVGAMSKSPLSVSGPAAGLTAIVLAGITTLGSFQLFLTAVIIAGVFQLLLGLLKAGTIGYYFPSSVISGMLAAIGIIIILKQIPYAVGHDARGIDDETLHFSMGFLQSLIQSLHPGVLVIGLASLLVMVFWDYYKPERLKLVPGAAFAVITGVLINFLYASAGWSNMIVESKYLVNLPIPDSFSEFVSQFTLPDFTQLFNKDLWIIAFTVGIVASIETLLTIEATDKLDPHKRFTDSNRELIAQGTGNILSGLIGGLPITSVIVRSSANLNAGAQSKLSAMVVGTMLLIGSLIIPGVLNYIPLASLAVILIVTGYKLCNPKVFKTMFTKSKYMWLPFLVTVISIVFTDLLVGVGIGMAVAVGFILIGNMKHSYYLRSGDIAGNKLFTIELSEEVSFLNKAALNLTLDKLPSGSTVILDATRTSYIDYDVMEMIREFDQIKAPDKNIRSILKGFETTYNIENNDHIFISENAGILMPDDFSEIPISSKHYIKDIKEKEKRAKEFSKKRKIIQSRTEDLIS